MRVPPLRPLLLALSLALGATTMSAQAQNAAGYAVPTDGTLLNISAQAEASRVPDVATLSAGVVTEADNGDAAMKQNATRMTQVMVAIRKAGIPEKDIQSSGVSLSPRYQYKDSEAPRINGYQASNTVSLKVRDISKLGDVLDTLAAQGTNQINGPSFEIDKPEPAYDEARLAALEKAQGRAQTYAKSLGLRVRRIVSISEGNNGGFRPVMMAAAPRAMKAEAFDSTPVAPGETTLSVNLDVVFELGK